MIYFWTICIITGVDIAKFLAFLADELRHA